MPLDLERLYDEHADALFGYALNLTRHEADAKEVVQEIFCQAAARPESFATMRDPRAFLLRLAHNRAIDLMRRQGTRDKNTTALAAVHPQFFLPTDHADEAQFREALAAALGELPAEQRAVAHLKLWEGHTFEQIATTLDISPNTAASRFRYAIDKLQARLRPLYHELQKSWTTSKNS